MSELDPDLKVLWRPCPQRFRRTRLATFLAYCEAATGATYPTAAALHRFSVEHSTRFWRLFLDWSAVSWDGDAATVCTSTDIEQATFFPDVTLNYAETLLAIAPDLDPGLPAIVSCCLDQTPVRLSRGELRARVAAAAMALQGLGIGPDSRVAVVARNDADAVVAVLAAASVGATIATASPDVGAPTTLGQLGQVAPVALLCHLGSPFAAAQAQLQDRIAAIVGGLPTLRCVVVLDHAAAPASLGIPVYHLAERAAGHDPASFVWPKLPFNHPLFVLSTSGTTGRPKCIVHGAGGSLIEHLKEQRLHCDLGPGDTLFFQTSTAWMMWHWQLSALASGVQIVLNAGPLTGAETLWRIVAEQAVTVFGTSPAYLHFCETAGYQPARHLDLGTLRAVLSTGSILSHRHQAWLSRDVKDLPIQSMSGGSDIIGCFVLGNPMVPAYAAECMSFSLGLDVRALITNRSALPPGAGELVCANPFPSRPLGFLDDPDGTRFHDAYFAQNPGVWTHGDLIEVTPRGSVRMLGRSDSVMNIRGIRIGPAELYQAIADIDEVTQALAVEQVAHDVPGNALLVLVVVLRDGVALDRALRDRIARAAARRASAAHVPSVILDVPALPITHSGKLSERSVQDVVNGRPAANAGSLRNPDCLAAIANHPALRRVAGPEAGDVGEPYVSPPPVWRQPSMTGREGNRAGGRVASMLAALRWPRVPLSRD